MSGLDLPAWSEPFTDIAGLARGMRLRGISRDWAWGGSTGAGIRVGIIDSGLETSHPRLNGRVVESVAVEMVDGEPNVVPDDGADLFGHATACGGIILGSRPRWSSSPSACLAPTCGARARRLLRAGMGDRAAARRLNLSLSSKSEALFPVFHELVDRGLLPGVPLVSAANNVPAPSYPSLFSSVFSVAAHGEAGSLALYYNPSPPVEFGAWGVDVPIAWKDGGTPWPPATASPRRTSPAGCSDPRQASGADAVRGQVGAGRCGGQPAPRKPGSGRYSLRRRGARSRQASPITFSSSASSMAGNRISTAG